MHEDIVSRHLDAAITTEDDHTFTLNDTTNTKYLDDVDNNGTLTVYGGECTDPYGLSRKQMRLFHFLMR